MKMEDIKKMDKAELEKEIAKSRHELLKLKLQTKAGQSKETHKVPELKKQIARMQTAIKLTKSAN